MFINDRAIEEMGFKLLEGQAGWIDLAPYDYALQTLAGQQGQTPVGSALTIGTRLLEVHLLVSPTTVAGRRAAIASLYSMIQGQIEVRFRDDPDRIHYCLPQSASGTGYEPIWVNAEVRLTLRLIAADPYVYQRVTTAQVLPANQRVSLLGRTAPWRGIIQVNGGGTGLIGAVLKHMSGAEIGRMEFSNPTNLVLDPADTLEIDCRNFIARQWVAAGDVWLEVTSTLAIGHDFLSFDPLDAPTLELLNGYDGHVRGRLADLA
jgi:hypothetical protein